MVVKQQRPAAASWLDPAGSNGPEDLGGGVIEDCDGGLAALRQHLDRGRGRQSACVLVAGWCPGRDGSAIAGPDRGTNLAGGPPPNPGRFTMARLAHLLPDLAPLKQAVQRWAAYVEDPADLVLLGDRL